MFRKDKMNKKKLKIAVFHNLPASGAIKALKDNLSYLKSKGHHIDVYTPETSDDSFAPLNEVADNVFVYPIKKSKTRKNIIKFCNIIKKTPILDSSHLYIPLKNFKKTQEKIANDIDKKDYDIVLCDQDVTFTTTPAFLTFIKTPTIYYCNQPWRYNEKILITLNEKHITTTILNKIYNKFILNKYIKLDIEYAQYAKHILTNSYFSHENLLKTYGKNSLVSYLGVNTKMFYPQNRIRKNFILSVGVIHPHKGFDFIINSISKIDETIRPKFVISTYHIMKEWEKYLLNLANEKNVELEIYKKIPNDELCKLYNEAKLVIFAPYLEAFGLVSLEALACGTPIIGVKEGGVREIIKHNENGLLLDRNENIFAKGISELLTNQEIWDKFSKNGSEYVSNYWTLEHAGQRLEDHIYRVLEEEKEE